VVHNVARPTVGGGLALFYHCTKLQNVQFQVVFQHTMYEVIALQLKFANNCALNNAGVYRLGRGRGRDYDLRYNKPDSRHSFKTTMTTLKLEQTVTLPTHVCGNTLDLVVHPYDVMPITPR